MVAVTELARQAGREENHRRFTVGAVTAKAVGVETEQQEQHFDHHTGVDLGFRPVLAWLPRSQVRLVAGEYEPGAQVLLDVPAWLLKKNGL